MKIRSGFVSNSSTSSFIIAFKKACPCPTCGLTPPDIVEAVKNRSDNDNRVRWTDPTAKLRELEQSICAYQRELEELGKCKSEEPLRPGCWTVGQQAAWTQSSLDEFSQLRQMIKEHHLNGDTVAEIEVWQHDDYLIETIHQMEKQKQIFIVYV